MLHGFITNHKAGLIYQPHEGTYVRDAAREIVTWVRDHGKEVTLLFNGVRVLVQPELTVANVVEDYRLDYAAQEQRWLSGELAKKRAEDRWRQRFHGRGAGPAVPEFKQEGMTDV